MTVWVVHPVKDDLSAAHQYGEIRYITDGYVHADELDGDRLPASVMEKISTALWAFDSNTDYFLIAGDHLQLVQVAAALADYTYGSFRVLRYDRQANGYFPVTIVTRVE